MDELDASSSSNSAGGLDAAGDAVRVERRGEDGRGRSSGSGVHCSLLVSFSLDMGGVVGGKEWLKWVTATLFCGRLWLYMEHDHVICVWR